MPLAGDHGLIHGSLALKHFAIDRHAVAGPDAKAVADLDQLKSNFLVRTLGRQAVRHFGSQFQQCADRRAGLLSGAQFQHLAQQHKNGDDGGGLEINRDGPSHAVKAGREHARRKGRKQAVEVGSTGPQRDQAGTC
jgi:hypothetical protein